MTNVLIIEDDPMVSFIHQKYLEKMGGFGSITIAKTVQAGLEATKKETPDLVLLDLHLQDGSGLSYLKEIREKKTDIEVIFITAANEVDIVKQSLHLGVLDYLVKPFSFERFAKSVQIFQEKQGKLAKTIQTVSQETIDDLFKQPTKTTESEYADWQNLPLEKGLTRSTLHLLVEKMKGLSEQFTAQELSEASKLSHVSVRKYLLFLEEKGLLESHSVYLKVGRPYQVYQLKKSE
ncbi:LytTR family transcriptional regulator [Enterococcus sp. JM4C]|uniref:response regulator n=1 Tax=Candidatus Enterococcus huntleyi TaxID=1857217 RepID=UPI001379F5D3|nr:response regulator [Enterococcus sp. JM4C]KAF1296407.1 LytTR family transcriptional regulator [Enterococcus sp. JM4C]